MFHIFHIFNSIYYTHSVAQLAIVIVCETELSLQSCARFVCNFYRSRPETAETEPLLRRPRKPLYPIKSMGFRARESCQTWIHAFPSCYTSKLLDDSPWWWWWRWWWRRWWWWWRRWRWWWCGWHDDVVDMLVRMLPTTIVRNWEVFELKLPLMIRKRERIPNNSQNLPRVLEASVPGQKELQALAQEQASQSHKTRCINTYFKISYH